MNRDAEVWRSGAGPQDKLVSGIYMEAPMEGIPQRYRSILGPLSLFTECTQNQGRVEEQRPVIPDLEGPRVTPTSLKELCHLVQCRIQGQPAPSSTSHEDRQTLAELLMSELGLVWRDLNALSSDPSLSQKENNQLHSEIFSEVIRVCEEIYIHCLQMLDTTSERAIFSNQANLIRVRAQMAMACSSLLNIHTIKENVTLGIKTMRKNRLSAAESNEHSEQGLPDMHSTPRRMNLSQQPKSSRAKSRPSQQQKDTIENDLKEITEKIEDLDLKLVYDLVTFPTEITNREVTQCVAENTHGAVGQKDDLTTSPRLCRMQSCSSMPELQQQMLLEEMQMEGAASRPQTPLVLPATPPSPEPAKPIDPAEDLRRLLEDSDPHEKMRLKDPEADVPPLIKALTHRSSTKPQLLQQSLQEEHLPSQLENEEKTAEKVLVEEPEHPQSAVVDVMFPPNFMARLAVARVTDRVYTDTISMQPYPPICNHLTGELDFSSVEWLDRNLFEGAEITEVYRELSESISSKHLEFDNDPIFEPAMEDTSFRKSPSTKRKRPCFINPELKGQNPAKVSQRRRTKNQPYHERPQDVTSREYKVWLQWWKSHLSVEDYLNYISTQELDYLGAVFHLYDSDDDESKTRPLTLQQKESKKRKEKIDALKSKKGEFETGLWNVNSVMLGGLGKDPELEERDKGSQRVQRPEGNQLQMRLEKLWRALCFPEGMRQDMALKYSSSTHRDQLQEAIVEWERTAQLIQQRETVLAQLEQFEKDASDPNRFFQQGYGGSSKARMDESKHREKLNSQMSALEKVLQRSIQEIKEHFNDTVTYRGRPYKEKMRWDRIEMLYWLQQERRIQALEKVVEGAGAIPARLPPLESRQKRSCTNPAENPHPDPEPHCQRLL
ncbi:coiled-coil domain-containing protein 87 [Conger conger]|uniref:coiled-coil domain-containing protein 87 n=1 Tax=Conger conger TaxID=82655 RepID=UPI002A5A1A2A|nr:coiled-coil domain-containing protein 87 [Conger conger]